MINDWKDELIGSLSVAIQTSEHRRNYWVVKNILVRLLLCFSAHPIPDGIPSPPPTPAVSLAPSALPASTYVSIPLTEPPVVPMEFELSSHPPQSL